MFLLNILVNAACIFLQSSTWFPTKTQVKFVGNFTIKHVNEAKGSHVKMTKLILQAKVLNIYQLYIWTYILYSSIIKKNLKNYIFYDRILQQIEVYFSKLIKYFLPNQSHVFCLRKIMIWESQFWNVQHGKRDNPRLIRGFC